MKVLNAKPKVKQEWSRKVTCGPLQNGPPVNGCGSDIEVNLSDIFHKEIQNPQITGRSFHWRCPVCSINNFIAFGDLPSLDVPSLNEYLVKLRKEVMIDIAKLHPTETRAEIIRGLGDDFLLDETIIQSVISELY